MRKVGRIAKRAILPVWAVVTVAFASLGMFGMASATCDPTADPTCGAAESFFTTVQTWLTDHGVAIAVGLLVIGVIVTLLIKYGKRAARAA